MVRLPVSASKSDRPRRLLRIVPLIGAGLTAAAAFWLIRRWRLPVNVTETTVAVTTPPPAPPPDDPTAERPLQPIHAGVGDFFHRRYQADITGAALTPEALIDAVRADINAFVARELAYFEKTTGDSDTWAIGDEWYVHITGPWDGPIRLIHNEPDMFAFITLEGHLEAGEIRFQAQPSPDVTDGVRFTIQSWARSRDWITDLFYQRLGISKAAQGALWTYFCNRAIELSGGELSGEITVSTQRVPQPKDAPPLWQRYQSDFSRWEQTALNFDPTQREDFTEVNGWKIDDYGVGLPSEPPGEPLPDGSWQTACDVVRNYEFPDPGLISGIFVPDRALEERTMILQAHFIGFRFLFGVKICDVTNEIREHPQRGSARVWGYGYRTLEGHFEMGQINFEVWKYLASGEVEFRVHAYSKVAHIHNPLYRLGFRLFGRSLQKRFARTALQRMQQLVIARTAHRDTPAAAEAGAVPEPAVPVQPISADADVQEKAEEIASGE